MLKGKITFKATINNTIKAISIVAESKESLVIKANVSNAAIGVDESFLKKVNNERFVLSGECASYTNYCRKDTVFPQSIEQINKFIRESINEIKKFLVEYYNFRLNNE